MVLEKAVLEYPAKEKNRTKRILKARDVIRTIPLLTEAPMN